MVRLPIHEGVLKVEDELIPDFNDKMKEVAVWSDGYLDMTPYNNEFIYVDGVHLHKVSGEIVTRKIAEWLKTKK